MKKFIFIVTIVFIGTLFTSCDPLIEDFKVEFLDEQIEVTINEEIDFKFTTTIKNLDEIIFSFEEPSLVEYKNGTYTAIQTGTTEVKVYWENDQTIFDTISLVINDLERKIVLTESEIKIVEEEKINLDLSLTNLRLDELNYSLSKANIISVASDFEITALAAGVVTLKVFYSENEDINASIVITVENKKVIGFTKEELVIRNFEKTELPLELVGMTSAEIEFVIEDPDILIIEDNYILPTNVGTTKVTAQLKSNPNVFASLEVTVNDYEYSIGFTQTEITLIEGDKTLLELELDYLTINELGFRFSNSEVISLSDEFEIEALKPGVSTLTVYYLNNEAIQAEITITVEIKKAINFTTTDLIIQEFKETLLPIEFVGMTSAEIEFIVEDEYVLIIENGYIIPKSAGATRVFARLESDPNISASINITIEEYNPVHTIYDHEYWIQNLASQFNPTKLIMTPEEINTYNNVILSDYSRTKVLDLLSLPEVISKADLEQMINSYSNMSSQSVYNNITNARISNSEKTTILNNRNLSEIQLLTLAEYGIITNFTAMRTYPTLYYANTTSIDRFQETGLNVGEGIIIYHTSSDGLWSFVQAQNYYGWIQNKDFAICTSNEMADFLTSENFIVVTANMLNINGVEVRMGRRIPYTAQTDTNYTISFPTRDANGNLVLEEITISKDLDIHDGYLPYTIENVLTQVFKMQGIPYRWGDLAVDGRDCSSTVNAVYITFGFMMPRNTSNQNNIPDYSAAVSLTEDELKAYQPGTLVFSSGHVLMYIGNDEQGKPYVIHNTNAHPAGCRVESVASFGINRFFRTLKLHN